MCGVYGILNLVNKRVCAKSLLKMESVTVHRGPDDSGSYSDGPILMGMRRLSIIDVDGGHQPITNEDDTVSVVCNGEIYNFRQLRTELLDRGHRFRTRSDAEVLVHLYEEMGAKFVDRIEGMFAFALWDAKQRKLLIGRDRLGIKPVYVKRDAERLIFASELKAILAVMDRVPEFDRVAVREYLALGYVPAPHSIFTGIEKLEAGTLLTIDASSGSQSTERYWWPRPIARTSDVDWIDALRDQLEQSVAAQMVSDVPVGAFLSGGIDSSCVVAMMAKHSSQSVRTYSIGFDDSGPGAMYNELQYARHVSDIFDTDHKEIIVRPDVASLLPKLMWHMDEPVADSAFITTHLVAELAADDVKVILSGVGGDELFGGYRRYLGTHYQRWMRLVPDIVRDDLLIPLARRLPSDRHSSLMNSFRLAKSFLVSSGLDERQRYAGYVGVFSDDLLRSFFRDDDGGSCRALARAFSNAGADDELSRVMEVDLLTQLPDDLLHLTDRMTMANSIECRVPLLDDQLVELALGMPSSVKIRGRELKHVLKKALEDILPDNILYRGKRGFGAPMGAWLKGPLLQMTRALLSEATIEARGLFCPDQVGKLIDDHLRSANDYSDHLQALTNLEIFSRIFVDGRDPSDISDELKELTETA